MNSKSGVPIHVPVMVSEVLEAFENSPKGWFIDGTFGLGGHSLALLNKYLDRKIFGIDLDTQSMLRSRALFHEYGNRILVVNGNYANMELLTKEAGVRIVGGILLDLGLSSVQLETEGRGFSFRNDEMLDMRYDQSKGVTALEIINTFDKGELAGIFLRFGEERAAKRIAGAVCANRPILTTGKLAKTIEDTLGRSRKSKIHPATKVFQALRIAVNQEFENINNVLMAGLDLLAVKGKFVVITYHSLEDRIVKQFFRKESIECVCPIDFPVCTCAHRRRLKIVNRKVIRPTVEEIDNNPRSRSAKMRIVEKIS